MSIEKINIDSSYCQIDVTCPITAGLGFVIANQIRYANNIHSDTPYECIILKINTEGGNTFDCLEIIQAMNESIIPVYTHNIGIAASAGAFIFLAGKERIMNTYSKLMFHDPHYSISNNLNKKDIETLEEVRGTIESYIKAQGFNYNELIAQGADQWFDTKEALSMGVATMVFAPKENTIMSNLNVNLDNTAFVNMLTTPKKMNYLSQLKNKDMETPKTEYNFEASIKSLETRMTECVASINAMVENMKSMDSKMIDMNANYIASKAQMDNMEARMVSMIEAPKEQMDDEEDIDDSMKDNIESKLRLFIGDKVMSVVADSKVIAEITESKKLSKINSLLKPYEDKHNELLETIKKELPTDGKVLIKR